MVEWNQAPNFESPRVEIDGEKTDIGSVLNRTILITGAQVIPSKFYEGNFGYISFEEQDGTKKYFTTSSQVLLAQIKEQADNGKTEFKARVVKIKRYYSLSAPEKVAE